MSIKVMTWVWDAGPPDPTERFLLLAMADMADDSGICWPAVGTIADRCCMSERNARRVIRKLEAGGWLLTEEQRGRNQTNRYRIQKPDTAMSARTNCPPGQNEHENRTNETVKPDTAMSDEPSRTVREPSQEKKGEFDDEFELVWEHYPRKVGKGAARKAWAKARKRLSFESLSKPLGLYIRAVRGSEDRFICHMATWLNEERWGDDPSAAINRPRTSTEDLARLRTISAAEDARNLLSDIPHLRIAK